MTGTDLTNVNDILQRRELEITLRIWHPTADPQQISKELQLQPTLAYMAGQPRFTPKGRALGSIHRETLWSYDLPTPKGISLTNAIKAAETLTTPHQNKLKRLVSQGARIEYLVGLFPNEDCTEIFTPELMLRCSEKNIHLILNIYIPRINKMSESS